MSHELEFLKIVNKIKFLTRGAMNPSCAPAQDLKFKWEMKKKIENDF